MFYDLWSGGGSIRDANAKFRSAHTINVKLGHLTLIRKDHNHN